MYTEFVLLEVKVPIVFLGTVGFSLRRDRRYPFPKFEHPKTPPHAYPVEFCHSFVAASCICIYAEPVASGDSLPAAGVFTELELLFAAAICQAGMAAVRGGAPVLNGLEVRPWRDATDSVPAALLTEAGFGVIFSDNEVPLTLLVFGVAAGVDAPMPDGLL